MTKLLGLNMQPKKSKVMTTIFALAVVAGSAAQTQGAGGTSRNGELHVTKECSQYTGAAGSYCTITSSNIAEIKVGSKVFYDQPANIPAGMLDSNVVLNVGTGDWAVGRCTLDVTTGQGLCTFSDGTGPLTGFKARVVVTFTGGVDYRWDGTYSFNPKPGN
jgi:hypothetical protein